jgi:hypothetical protein
MSPDLSVGSTDPALRGSFSDERLKHVPEAVLQLVGAESILKIESDLDDLRTLQDLRNDANPFANRRGNQVDINQFDPHIQDDLRKLFAKKHKPLAVVKKLSSKDYRRFIKDVQAQEKQISDRARQSNTNLRDYHADDLLKLHDEAVVSEQLLDLARILPIGESLEQSAQSIPTNETISALESLWDVCSEHPRRQQARLERAPGGVIPGHKVIIGGFRLLKSGENRLMEYSKGSLGMVRRIADVLSDNGSKAFEVYQSIVKLEEIKRVAGISEEIQQRKRELLDEFSRSRPEDMLPYITAERYLVDVAAKATGVLLKELEEIIPEEHDDYDDVYPQLIQEVEDVLIPYIANAIEGARQEAAAGFSKRVTEANDIILGGRRLKPNKKVRQPDVLSDALDKILNGEGLAYRTEKGLIIAMLSGRFNMFVDTLNELRHPDAAAVIETLRATRGRIVDDLLTLDLDAHMGNLDVIMVEYAQKLEKLLSKDEFKRINDFLKAYFNNPQEESVGSDQPTYGSNKLLEDVFEREDLIGILDWTILPIEKGDEELEKAAREIVSQAQQRAERGTRVEIDLARLNILKKLREQWGKDRCEYFRGKLRNSGVVEGSDRPDEYIVLVMRELDEHGNIRQEHAVAESPIAGVNALYLLRGDVAAGSWREIFSMPKKDARALGARKLLHTKGDGRPMVEFLTDRVQTLLTCSPDEFFRIRFQGSSFWMQNSESSARKR